MRTVADWLDEYGVSHTHPTNKLLHWICVPPIVLSVMGFLWSVPVPASIATISASPSGAWLNWATLVAVFAIVYYAMLSVRLAIGIALAFAVLFAIVQALS